MFASVIFATMALPVSTFSVPMCVTVKVKLNSLSPVPPRLHVMPRLPRSRIWSVAPSLVHDMYVAERGGLVPVPADGVTLGEVLLRGENAVQ